jgi:hypothetical protein
MIRTPSGCPRPPPAEVLVDCVTYVVLGSVGLDVGGVSIPYVAGWGEDGALDAIQEYAQTIDELAKRIEDAIAAPAPASADAMDGANQGNVSGCP